MDRWFQWKPPVNSMQLFEDKEIQAAPVNSSTFFGGEEIQAAPAKAPQWFRIARRAPGQVGPSALEMSSALPAVPQAPRKKETDRWNRVKIGSVELFLLLRSGALSRECGNAKKNHSTGGSQLPKGPELKGAHLLAPLRKMDQNWKAKRSKGQKDQNQKVKRSIRFGLVTFPWGFRFIPSVPEHG